MVYKYCSISGGIGILENNFLKFTAPQDFNDPYDIAPTIKPYGAKDFFRIYGDRNRMEGLFQQLLENKEVSTREQFRKYLWDPRFWTLILTRDSKGIQKVIDNYQLEIARSFRVCCFSETPLNLLMWAHYARNFSGCIFGFDFDSRTEFRENLRKVEYRSKPVQLDVKYFYGEKYNRKVMDEVMVRKARDWSYERETRLIMTKDNLSTLEIDGKEEYGLPNALSYLRRVIIGARTEDKTLHSWISRASILLGIPIEVGALLRKEYRVEVNPLSEHMSQEQKELVGTMGI